MSKIFLLGFSVSHPFKRLKVVVWKEICLGRGHGNS